MKKLSLRGIVQGVTWTLLFAAAVLCVAAPSVSDDFADRRITAGAKIFRALLAADVDITGKTAGDGRLRICLVYANDTGNAEIAAEALLGREDTRIRDLEVTVEAEPFPSCMEESGRIAGVFLTEVLNGEELQRLLEHANKAQYVVFSPFEGDVERGVLGGIAVEARVRPYLNMHAAQAAGIHLKPFFVRVAKQYE